MSVTSSFDYRDRTRASEFNPKREACATCRFWKPHAQPGDDPNSTDELGFGFCRRQPPRLIESLVQLCAGKPSFGDQCDIEDVFGASDHFDATAYPGTFHSEWCGEFAWLPKLQPVELPVC